MRTRQMGQVAVEFALMLGLLFAVGLTAWQFAGLGLTAIKVGHAAQEAAYVAAANPTAATAGETPCWAVTGGLRDPGAYADAEVCRTVLENLGNLNPDLATVSVARVSHGRLTTYTVAIVYQQPVTSPLLRLLFGRSVRVTTEATSA